MVRICNITGDTPNPNNWKPEFLRHALEIVLNKYDDNLAKLVELQNSDREIFGMLQKRIQKQRK